MPAGTPPERPKRFPARFETTADGNAIHVDNVYHPWPRGAFVGGIDHERAGSRDIPDSVVARQRRRPDMPA